jgi:hypothetical protein
MNAIDSLAAEATRLSQDSTWLAALLGALSSQADEGVAKALLHLLEDEPDMADTLYRHLCTFVFNPFETNRATTEVCQETIACLAIRWGVPLAEVSS